MSLSVLNPLLTVPPEDLLLVAVGVPAVAAALIPLFHRLPNIRELVTILAALIVALTVWTIAGHVATGAQPERLLIEVLPGLPIAFRVEPLGMMFALVAGSLWLVNSVYSIGYMRAGDEPRQTTFYVCFAIAIASAIGLAFSANLFTMFLFYEMLTISTWPLVVHKQNEDAIKAGRIYLLLLIGTSMLLFLPAILITWSLAGTVDFRAGGIMPATVEPALLSILLALYAFGIGKAALMPFHFWLPAAMVAPTPVSALLHAVAVVKAGVFTVLKVIIYVFGIERLSAAGASDWLVAFASFCLIAASLVALTRGNLKARLAYSTVSQLAYVVLAAALVTSAGVLGGALHIVMHAAGKITLFFCAGAIYVAHHKTEISELDGIGRKMPWTMAAFTIGALSIIGLPPMGGSWSKWQIALGALDAGKFYVVVVLMLSSLLNVAYLLSIVGRAYFRPAVAQATHGHGEHGSTDADGKEGGRSVIEEAPLACLLPLLFTALLCVVLFFTAGDIEAFLAPIGARASGG